MSKHTDFLRLAATGVDFELEPADRRALAEHLQGCDACRQTSESLFADATSLRSLPRRSPSPRVADAIARAARGETRTSRPPLMLLGLGFLLAAGLAGAVIGAAALRQALPDRSIVSPSALPSAAAIVPPSPSNQLSTIDPRLGLEWQKVTPESDGLSGTSANAVTANGLGFVTVGRTCQPDPAGGEAQCWGGVQLSTNGLTWEIVPRQPGLEIGNYYPPSGPGADMIGVAAGRTGLVAMGYSMDGGTTIATGGSLRPAVWVSADGRTWERAPVGSVFEGARFSDIAATDKGFVIVGALYGPGPPQGKPHGAIWTSEDGRAWRRVPDDPIFDIGGFLDTGEDPGSGGPRRLTVDGAAILSVGSVCNDQGLACQTAFWSSPDGSTWERVVLDEPNASASDVAFNAAGWVAVGLAGEVGNCGPQRQCMAAAFRSPDGHTWPPLPVEVAAGAFPPDAFTDVVVVGDRIMAIGAELEGEGLAENGGLGPLWLSTDGRIWTPVQGVPADYSPARYQPMAAGPERVVIVGDIQSRILVSPPG